MKTLAYSLVKYMNIIVSRLLCTFDQFGHFWAFYKFWYFALQIVKSEVGFIFLFFKTMFMSFFNIFRDQIFSVNKRTQTTSCIYSTFLYESITMSINHWLPEASSAAHVNDVVSHPPPPPPPSCHTCKPFQHCSPPLALLSADMAGRRPVFDGGKTAH